MCPHSCRSCKSRVHCQHLVLVRALFLACRWQLSCTVLTLPPLCFCFQPGVSSSEAPALAGPVPKHSLTPNTWRQGLQNTNLERGPNVVLNAKEIFQTCLYASTYNTALLPHTILTFNNLLLQSLGKGYSVTLVFVAGACTLWFGE